MTRDLFAYSTWRLAGLTVIAFLGACAPAAEEATMTGPVELPSNWAGLLRAGLRMIPGRWSAC